MSEVLIFSLGTTVILTIFLVTLIEFVLSHGRKGESEKEETDHEKIEEEHKKELADLKKKYETKLKEAEKAATDAPLDVSKAEEDDMAKKYEAQIAEMTSSNEKELEKAKEKIKKMEADAKIEVEEYMNARESEVEDQLMELVLSVTKRVLPDGLTYEIQKELVSSALQEARSEHS